MAPPGAFAGGDCDRQWAGSDSGSARPQAAYGWRSPQRENADHVGLQRQRGMTPAAPA